MLFASKYFFYVIQSPQAPNGQPQIVLIPTKGLLAIHDSQHTQYQGRQQSKEIAKPIDRKIDRDAYSSSLKVLNVTSNTYNSR